MLPSSHSSFPTITPSPHTGEHWLGVMGPPSLLHIHPVSTAHAASQPSPLPVFPSSQASPAASFPSPHTAAPPLPPLPPLPPVGLPAVPAEVPAEPATMLPAAPAEVPPAPPVLL